MNKSRRKSLQSIIDRLEELKSDLEILQEEEETCRDNIPESLWGSERYEKVEAAASNLEDAVGSMDEVISSIEAAIE